MKKIILILFVFLSLSSNLLPFSNEVENSERVISKIGIFGSYNLVQNQANFSSFPDYKSCCPSFGSSNSSGFTTGFIYNQNISSNLDLQLRLGFNSFNSKFSSNEYIGNGYDENTKVVKVYSDHSAEVKISNIEFHPILINKNLIKGINIMFGLNVGYIIKNSFSQFEKLVTPNLSVDYLNSKLPREWVNIQDKPINNLKIQTSLSFGLGTDIETKMLLISPEISYNYNFFDIADNLNWKTNEVRIGTSISYISKTEIPKIEPTPEITIIKPIEIPKVVEPVKIEKKIIRPTIISNVQASVQAEGKDTNVVKIVIEDHFSRYLYPLLSYVFFDENSSELRPRYVNLSQKDKLTFNEKTQFINSNSLIVYYNLINVIGKRLKSRPNSKITLIGCNSNTGNEKNNIELSIKRAETIKNVLVKDWEINPENIIVESRNLPRNYSRGGLIEHEEENRRVEIYSDDFIITEPVTAIDSFKTSKQTEIKIKATAISSVEITEWKFKVFQMNNLKENLFLEVNGVKNIDSTFNWVLNNKSKLPDNESDVIYKLESKIHQTDFDTNSVVYGKINVDLLNFRKQEESKYNYIEKFKIKLIMFDHNSSEVSTNNKKIIDLICKSITPKSTVKVKGSTDYLGVEKDNKKLSENRANMIMNSIKCKPKSIESFGLGHVDLFTDKTPEARFFCRTVEVFVETPVN